jgi:hypothetical protein
LIAAMIFYTNRFIKPWAAGCARGPFIFIRPQYHADLGILAHERVHVRQWWRTFGLHSILYPFSREYRMWAEAEAYKAQLEFSPGNLSYFAARMVEHYDLRITQAHAEAAIISAP